MLGSVLGVEPTKKKKKKNVYFLFTYFIFKLLEAF